MSRVTEIRYVGYGVPDLAAERDFYRSVWGLRLAQESEGMAYLAAEGHDEPYVVRLRAAPEKRIDVIGLATETRADVDALHERVAAAGCRIISKPSPLASPGGATASASSRRTACPSRSPATSRGDPSAISGAGRRSRSGSATSSYIRPTTRRWFSS